MKPVTKKQKKVGDGARRTPRAITRLASLSEQVREQIRKQIVHGELKAGARLVELEIAAAMGVSQGRCARLCSDSKAKVLSSGRTAQRAT